LTEKLDEAIKRSADKLNYPDSMEQEEFKDDNENARNHL
jgi:hypothetical protein